jgi:DnaJ-class molecular chaperone
MTEKTCPNCHGAGEIEHPQEQGQVWPALCGECKGKGTK